MGERFTKKVVVYLTTTRPISSYSIRPTKVNDQNRFVMLPSMEGLLISINANDKKLAEAVREAFEMCD